MKPMLAAAADLKTLRYPLYASPKLDGVRALNVNGKLFSRSLKPIPNPYVNKLFGRKELDGLDGELISGDPCAKDVYRVTVGNVSRETGEPDVTFYVFDYHDTSMEFADRKNMLSESTMVPGVFALPQHLIGDEEHLFKYESECLELGYEGLILRSPEGKYKFGRSTANEQGMLKLKRFTDGEAEILEVLEEEHNANEAKRNELGRTARSTAKAGMVRTGRAGALRVHDAVAKVEFCIGTGLNDKDREFFWKHRKRVVGQLIKYKSFAIGVKDKPRFPVYLGPREPWDLG